MYAHLDSLAPDTARAIEDAFAGQQQWVAPTPEQIAEEITVHRGSYLTVLPTRANNSLIMQVGFIPFFMLWRGTGAMLLGLALARLGVLTGARSARFYLRMMLACYGVGLPLVIGGVIFNFANDFSLGTFSLIGAQFNMVGSLPVALGHIALVMLLVRLNVLGWLGTALAASGRMALTNYLMQSLLCTFIFYGYGLGYFGSLDRLEQELVVLGIWILQLAVSPMWLRRYRFGPAEWGWRSLTYWSLQPMRR